MLTFDGILKLSVQPGVTSFSPDLPILALHPLERGLYGQQTQEIHFWH